MTAHPLDHPQWAALSGPHAKFARRSGLAATYQDDLTPMSGLADPLDPTAWADLAALLGAGAQTILMFRDAVPLPATVRPLLDRKIVQMLGPAAPPPPSPRAPEGLVRLGPEHGERMVALAALTEPGPMHAQTVRLGHFWGVERDGRLVAMAGERMHLDGLVEVSGVATHPAYRGLGLARALIARVVHDIVARGERAFLHVKTENQSARGLYERLGFTWRTDIDLKVVEIAG